MGYGSTRVLVTGDAEADLAAIRVSDCDSEVVRGIGGACAALRLADFGVVVADVAAAHDALAIARAAARGRPAARVICLLPAHADPRVLELVERSTHVVRRHPVLRGELDALVAEACAEYEAERGRAVSGVTPFARPERDGGIERELAAALCGLAERAGGRLDRATRTAVGDAVRAAVLVARTDGAVSTLRVLADRLEAAAQADEVAA